MTKRQLIDRITTINVSAHPSFLASFGEDDLKAYLSHLGVLEQPRLSGGPGRFEKYFRAAPKPQFIYDAAHESDQAPAAIDEDLLVPMSDDELPEHAPDAGEYQTPQPDATESHDVAPVERPLAPVMAGAQETDKSYVGDDEDGDSWLF